MKRFIFLTTVFMLLSSHAMGQVFEIPKLVGLQSELRVHFIGIFKQTGDGLWNYTDYGQGREAKPGEYLQFSIGNERYFCYDKKNNLYYFYTDNVIGFYNPISKADFGKVKKGVKANNVPKVTSETFPTILKKIIAERSEIFNKKNEAYFDTQRAIREKFVKDSIETAQRQEKERDEYRKTNDWHKLQLSKKHNLKCQYCDLDHRFDKTHLISINEDTIYYFHDDQNIILLNTELVKLHYSAMTQDLKKDSKFRNHLEVWNDSIANSMKLTNREADIINIVWFDEFQTNIKSVAPNGFVRKWGWNLNSANGVEPYFSFFNTSNKTIKYVDFYFSIFNAVGDKCYLKFEKSYIGNVRGVGPIESFETGSWNWDRATHYTSGDASEMKIVKIVITYMDKTTKILTGNSLIIE